MKMSYSKKHRFHWEGISPDGKRASGDIHANNINATKAALHHDRITPIKIKRYRHHRIHEKHIAHFTRQLATVLKTGIPLCTALRIISEDCYHPALQQLLLQMKIKLENGASFTQTIKHFSDYFDATYCNLVAAGEQAGTLTETISQLADQIERMRNIKKKLRHATIYPSTVLTSAILISIALLLLVVPQFQTLFANAGTQLPLLTRIVIHVADALHRYGLAFILIGITATFFFRILKKHHHGFAALYHSILLRIPLLNKLLITINIARWTRTLSNTYASGMPLIDALTLANNTITDGILKKSMQTLPAHVQCGYSIHQSLENIKFFPCQARQLIAIGENTGTLESILTHIADIYQTRFDHTMEHLNKLLEPVMMLFLGLFVGGLIIALKLSRLRRQISFA